MSDTSDLAVRVLDDRDIESEVPGASLEGRLPESQDPRLAGALTPAVESKQGSPAKLWNWLPKSARLHGPALFVVKAHH